MWISLRKPRRLLAHWHESSASMAEFNLGDHSQGRGESQESQMRLIETVSWRPAPADRNALLRSAVIAQDRMMLADTDSRAARSAGSHMQPRRPGASRRFLSREDSAHPVRLEGFLRAGDARAVREYWSCRSVYEYRSWSYVNLHLYSEGARATPGAPWKSRGPSPPLQTLRAQALSILANALRYQGDLEAALSTVREARAVSEKAVYASDAARFFNLYGLIHREALILGEADAVNLDRPAEAIELLGKALDMTEEAARKDPHDSASRGRLGTTAPGTG